MRVELGKNYKSKVCWREGMATARTEHLGGLVQVLLRIVTSNAVEEHWFFETDLEPIESPGSELKPRKRRPR